LAKWRIYWIQMLLLFLVITFGLAASWVFHYSKNDWQTSQSVL
jgi:hypothetical protein